MPNIDIVSYASTKNESVVKYRPLTKKKQLKLTAKAWCAEI